MGSWLLLVDHRREPAANYPSQNGLVVRCTSASTCSRRNVFSPDKMTYQYCGKQPGSEELTIDHVVPRSQGGMSTWTNCVLACIDCNSKKADRTPVQSRMKLRKEPVRPTWKPIYSDRMNRVNCWSKFVSEAYWTVELED